MASTTYHGAGPCTMHHALGPKNKLKCVNGSFDIPDNDDLDFAQWKCCNCFIHSWIINLISEQMSSTINFHENSLEAWNDLHERFSKVDRIRILTL